jgi:anti-sigma factor RsiW
MRDGATVAKAQDLTCQELVELVTDYLEGTLAPAERARFDAHIASCTNCRRYLDQMRRTIATLPRLTEETIQPEARETLLQAFRKWKAG